MAETKKYLDLAGLTSYDQKIKALIASDDATVLETAQQFAQNLGSNYDPAGTAQTKVTELANGQVATNKSDIATLKSGKADKATTLAGYGIGDAYTKTQTDSAIATAVANADHLKRQIVTSLPATSAADENTIYMVGSGTGSQDSVYEEYMLVNGGFEKIGSSEVDLTDYALKSYVDQAESDAVATAGTNADSKIAAKVGDIGSSTVKAYVDQAETDAVASAKSYADGLAGNYATAAQGALADTAVQPGDLGSAASLTAGSASGNVPINGAALGTTANVPVVTNTSGRLVPHASGALGSAAFANTSAFDAAGTASNLVTTLQNGAVKTNSDNITALSSRIDTLEGTSYVAITTTEIEALFA